MESIENSTFHGHQWIHTPLDAIADDIFENDFGCSLPDIPNFGDELLTTLSSWENEFYENQISALWIINEKE